MIWGDGLALNLLACGKGIRGAGSTGRRTCICTDEFMENAPEAKRTGRKPEKTVPGTGQANPAISAVHQQGSDLNTFQGVGGNGIRPKALRGDGVGQKSWTTEQHRNLRVARLALQVVH